MGTILGLLSLATAVGAVATWFQRIRNVAIPEDRTPWVAAALTAAGLGVVALASSPGWIGGVPAGLGALVGAFLVFTVAISAQKTEGAIDVGDAVPDVSALDDTGARVDLASFAGAPALYKFFRGHW